MSVSPSPQGSLEPLMVLWQLLLVGVALVAFSWVGMILVLSLPVTVGRWLIRYLLAVHAARVSDFSPLSLGVVLLSVAILATVKACEALLAILSHAATLEHRRRARHVLVCTCSFAAMALVTLALIPMGIGMLT